MIVDPDCGVYHNYHVGVGACGRQGANSIDRVSGGCVQMFYVGNSLVRPSRNNRI